MRIRPLLLILQFPITLTMVAQWQWTSAVQSVGANVQQGNSVAHCPDGGVVVLGTFREAVQLGGLSFNLPAANQVGGFVVKYDSLGAVNWAHKIESTDPVSDPYFNDVAVDADGSVIVLGALRDTVLIDNAFATANGNGLANARAFVVIKFTEDGSFQWASDHEMQASNNISTAVTTAPNGDVWVVGQTGNDSGRLLRFDGVTGAQAVNVSGLIGWMYDVRTDDAGNVYATGLAPNVFTAGSLTCPLNQVYQGTTSRWVGKFDSNGNALWYYVPPQGGSGYNFWPALNMAVATNGTCFVETDRKTVINGDTIAWASYEHGLYLLDGNGAVQWTRRINDDGVLYVNDLSTTSDGDVWVTGTMSGTVDLVDTVVTHNGLYLFRYSGTGALLDVVLGPMVSACNATAAEVDGVVLTGNFGGNINFGTLPLSGTSDMFTARYGVPFDVGIEDAGNAASITAYPNPAQDGVRLRGWDRTPVTVEVFDALGRRVLRIASFRIDQDALDLSQLVEGMLSLHITCGTKRAALRVMHLH
jgi:hypothetical protein